MNANSRNIKCSRCGEIVGQYSGPNNPAVCKKCRGGGRPDEKAEGSAKPAGRGRGRGKPAVGAKSARATGQPKNKEQGEGRNAQAAEADEGKPPEA